MVVNMNKNGLESICETVSEMQEKLLFFRYENALSSTTSSSIRKGAVYGLFVGWVSFQLDLIYAIGFMAGSLLLNMQGRVQLSISDVIIVSFFGT